MPSKAATIDAQGPTVAGARLLHTENRPPPRRGKSGLTFRSGDNAVLDVRHRIKGGDASAREL